MTETQREAVPRDDAGELDVALAFLRFSRHCLLKKLEGLDEEQARRRVVDSDTTLIGLVQHCAAGERYWFAHVVGGDPAYADTDFTMVVPAERSLDAVLTDYREACAEADRHLAAAGSPDTLTAVAVDDEPKSVRWVVAHMTSEVARHTGHADVLRELVDGTTGR